MNSSSTAENVTPLDVIVFGATSFVGQILCRALLREFGVAGSPGARTLRWGVAGRSQTKLEALLASLQTTTGASARDIPTFLADSHDDASLLRLCAQARVIVSTVGPYLRSGEPLVRACARTGTDYCDLTGELPWVARMIRLYSEEASRTGARLISCCGFDSIPSDLGIHALQEEALRRFGAPCVDAEMVVQSIRGGASGGTIASLVAILEEARADSVARRDLADPYSLCPSSWMERPRQTSVMGPSWDATSTQWVAPFVMSNMNVAVVLRSHALRSAGLGAWPLPSSSPLLYREAFRGGGGRAGMARAFGLSAGISAFVGALAFPPTKWILEHMALPSPGQGPSLAAQERGSFDLRFFGKTAKGETLRLQLTGNGDPGYSSTARMLAETCACLAREVPRDRVGGGFWTPSTAMGPTLQRRLIDHAGIRITFLDGTPAPMVQTEHDQQAQPGLSEGRR